MRLRLSSRLGREGGGQLQPIWPGRRPRDTSQRPLHVGHTARATQPGLLPRFYLESGLGALALRRVCLCHQTGLRSALRNGQMGPLHAHPAPPEATEQTSAVSGVPRGLGGLGQLLGRTHRPHHAASRAQTQPEVPAGIPSGLALRVAPAMGPLGPRLL